MHHQRRILVAGVAATLLSACSSLPFNVPPDYQLDARRGTGVAVFSISEACPSTMSIKIKSDASGFDEVIGVDQSRAARAAPLQWHQPCGRLVVRELPAGNYQVASFVLVGAVPGVTYLQPTRDIAVPFRVQAGKASYLGHLNFDITLPARMFTLTVEDRRDRDIPLLKAHARSIRDQDIVLPDTRSLVKYTHQPMQAVRVMFTVVR